MVEEEKDIVERLRDGTNTHAYAEVLMDEAADEIERLRDELHTAFARGLDRGIAEGMSQKEYQERQDYRAALGQERGGDEEDTAKALDTVDKNFG